MTFLAFKWLHIVAIISWMAGVLYLLRLCVYHVERGLANADIHEMLTTMEGRLYRNITMPAMGVAWLAGLGMVTLQPDLMRGAGWLHTKILLVVLLTIATVHAGRLTKRLAKRTGPFPSGKTLRILNEVPAVLMIVIVGLVVFKPF